MSGRPDRELAERFLRGLVGLGKAQALYPEGHGAIRRALEALGPVLERIMEVPEPLLVARTDAYLMVGDVPFVPEGPPSADLDRWFQNASVEAVEFGPGVRPREVLRFLGWLLDPGSGPWAGTHIRIARLADEGGAWGRGIRTYREAVEALEQAYREVQEGRIPDPGRALVTVRSFMGLLDENPDVVRGLALIKDYDRYTFHHSVNVCLLALAVGQFLGTEPSLLEVLGVGGLFHDIGKIRTPPEIIRKPARLTPAEWDQIRLHPEHGRRIVEEMGTAPPGAALLAYEHHMYRDGAGYPPQPPGYRLFELSPLVAVVDVFDAMTTHRPYSRPMPLPEAVENIRAAAGSRFDPEAVRAFVGVMGRIPVGSAVRLATGEVAVVARLDGEGLPVRAIVVADGAGGRLPRNRWVSREISPHQVLRWVDPLVHGINPHEVLAGEEGPVGPVPPRRPHGSGDRRGGPVP